MSKSNLISATYPAYFGNYTKGRSQKISKITIHHMAGVLSAKQCGQIFQTPGRNASSHYGIGKNGEIANYVDEEDTAWCDSNWNSNSKSVTIETSNSESGGNWPISNVVLNSLINLIADVAKRNNLGLLIKGKNVTWHSMYKNTSCPGEYLLSKMDYIINEANKINSGDESSSSTDGIISKIQTWYNNIYSSTLGSIDVDNSFGPDSRKHFIKALQYEMNKQYGCKLDIDGSFGPSSKACFKNLKRGVSGNITRICQAFLYYKGYDPKGFDGLYGEGMQVAVKSFQSKNNFSVDGILGRNTAYKLFN